MWVYYSSGMINYRHWTSVSRESEGGELVEMIRLRRWRSDSVMRERGGLLAPTTVFYLFNQCSIHQQ